MVLPLAVSAWRSRLRPPEKRAMTSPVDGGSALSRRAAIQLSVGAGIGLAGTGGGMVRYRATHVGRPLLSETVALRGPRTLDLVSPGSGPGLMVADTRVLRGAVDEDRLISEQRAWMSSGATWTREAGAWSALVQAASLDLHVLMIASPAPVAGWSPFWRFVWPRDAAHAAAALARTGRAQQAVPIMEFLQRVQHPSGWFEARYLPDGSGPPDNRARQLDGTGWALWALADVVDHLPAAQGDYVANGMRPLIGRCLTLIYAQTNNATGLPSPSPDYWETPEDTLTLGTVAPLAAGLWGAQRLLSRLGDQPAAQRALEGERGLRQAIESRFQRDGYPRHLGRDDPDAAIAFLLPPYAAHVSLAPLDALIAAEKKMRRAGGGLAPGTGWKNDGISWTPETAQTALAYASSGRAADAARLLSWIDTHRTSYGSIPEKVLHNGAPAGPAPLSWTAALVLLTIEALTRT